MKYYNQWKVHRKVLLKILNISPETEEQWDFSFHMNFDGLINSLNN